MYKFTLFLLFVLAQNAVSQVAIDTGNIRKHLQYLADDGLEGRFPGTDGAIKAAGYIAEKLKYFHFSPLYRNGMQAFDFDMKNTDSTKKNIKTYNVAYCRKGAAKPDEYIVIGAHYDHLGMGGYGSASRKPDTVAVHNGADDNASGVAVMLACAEALSQIPTDRSIIFVAFSAEEEGLWGSKYFVEHPPVELRNIKAMINLDMVGRLDSVLSVSGIGTALQLDTVVASVYSSHFKTSFKMETNASGYGPSDQTSFCMDSVPVLFLHTSIHEQYHTPEDDVSLINIKGCGDIASFVVEIAKLLGRQNQDLTYQAIGNPLSFRGMAKTTLGIMPDHASSGNGLKVNGVRPGGPAEMAGVLKNDVICRINDESISDIMSYMNTMNKFNKGETVYVTVLRNTVEIKLKVEL